VIVRWAPCEDVEQHGRVDHVASQPAFGDERVVTVALSKVGR
jgi:hypothetical protein